MDLEDYSKACFCFYRFSHEASHYVKSFSREGRHSENVFRWLNCSHLFHTILQDIQDSKCFELERECEALKLNLCTAGGLVL